MSQKSCVACHASLPASKLCRVVIEGRSINLCRLHAGRVAIERPSTFEELRRMFNELPSDKAPLARRSLVDRRIPDDRRMFPPRPEGRRLVEGRRDNDAESP